MRIDISLIKEDKPIEVVLLIENTYINLMLFYKINKTINKIYIEVKQLYYQQSHDKYIDKSIIEVECQKTGFGYRRFFKCPHCGKRRKYLYPVGIGLFACRDCIERNVYAYRTNIYDENIENVIKYKIVMNLLKLNFDLDNIEIINFKGFGKKTINMLNLLANIPDKPKNMRWSKYEIICKRIYFLHFIYWKIVNEEVERIKTKELNDMLDERNVNFAYENIIAPIYIQN
ncbi:transposase [Clostridium perfringens]